MLNIDETSSIYISADDNKLKYYMEVYFMENTQNKDTFVEELSETELEMVSGGRKGKGWLASITDDCPNSVIVCC